ncbi:peroxisomal targeting signal 2 receptor [Platysternon megacephalum]|uniref:Peroxisomal targeting signal 2 receptor n=1 Tax=Platysternon megacephalum TaxID=55544 RepID=A0A4D9E403_9SAUR|nr:peroxisomal targeting signal 2 receptor [Platysternon megacephalum]
MGQKRDFHRPQARVTHITPSGGKVKDKDSHRVAQVTVQLHEFTSPHHTSELPSTTFVHGADQPQDGASLLRLLGLMCILLPRNLTPQVVPLFLQLDLNG